VRNCRGSLVVPSPSITSGKELVFNITNRIIVLGSAGLHVRPSCRIQQWMAAWVQGLALVTITPPEQMQKVVVHRGS
jgi:hypothetical protein